jgi:RimJ/RimL family protein N-acetyltransferase
MRHDIRIKGIAFGLRPVELTDANFIFNLRSDPEYTKLIHPISPYLVDQVAYIKEYFKRPGDYYFIVERICDNSSEGALSIYNVDGQRKCGEFGRWILSRGSLGAVESALLLYRMAFDILNLDMVYSRTTAENKHVISFHQSCGLKVRGILKNHFNINGLLYDAVEQYITRDIWAKLEPRLAKKAELVANVLKR